MPVEGGLVIRKKRPTVKTLNKDCQHTLGFKSCEYARITKSLRPKAGGEFFKSGNYLNYHTPSMDTQILEKRERLYTDSYSHSDGKHKHK